MYYRGHPRAPIRSETTFDPFAPSALRESDKSDDSSFGELVEGAVHGSRPTHHEREWTDYFVGGNYSNLICLLKTAPLMMKIGMLSLVTCL